MKKKIIILSNDSGSLYLFRFELLKELINKNYEITISVPVKDSIYIRNMKAIGVKHIYTGMERRSSGLSDNFKLLIDYYKLIKKYKPDLILTYTIKPNIYGNLVANILKVPVISNITGIGTSLASKRSNFAFKLLYKFALRKTKFVFFQNVSNLNFFLDNKLMNSNNTRLIPGSGINLHKFQPLDKTFSDKKIRFLFIGRVMKEKGIEELFLAASDLSSKYPNIIFQIVGLLEEDKYKIKLINSSNIEFLGKFDDIRIAIKDVDCIINPSYHEGMSNVLLEGAAMGKPLLASNIPGCREIVEDGYNGFLFEPKSVESLEKAIIRFIELTEEKKAIMGRNSRSKVVNEFDREIVVNEYIKTINELTKAKR